MVSFRVLLGDENGTVIGYKWGALISDQYSVFSGQLSVVSFWYDLGDRKGAEVSYKWWGSNQ